MGVDQFSVDWAIVSDENGGIVAWVEHHLGRNAWKKGCCEARPLTSNATAIHRCGGPWNGWSSGVPSFSNDWVLF